MWLWAFGVLMSAGAGWEAELRSWHRKYRAAGLAHVVKVDPPVKQVQQLGKGRFVGVVTQKGPVDFIGVAMGRPVAFDAKRTDKPTFSVSIIPEHQRRDLDRWAEHGAFTFIALRCSAGRFVLPWEHIRAVSGAMDPRVRGTEMGEDGWISCLPKP